MNKPVVLVITDDPQFHSLLRDVDGPVRNDFSIFTSELSANSTLYRMSSNSNSVQRFVKLTRQTSQNNVFSSRLEDNTSAWRRFQLNEHVVVLHNFNW